MPILNSTIDITTKIWQPDLVNIYGSTIGRYCNIGAFVEIGISTIGNGCKIGTGAYICPGSVIEDLVFIAPRVVTCNMKIPRAFIDKSSKLIGPTIKTGATIGANATILPGVVIGEFSFVAAGAVVTHDVLPFTLVSGVPAREIAKIDKQGAVSK